MDVKIVKTDDHAYDAFVSQRPNGRICHLLAWSDVVARTSGLKNFYLAAQDGGQIYGVLPLMHIRSHLFGNRMISQAFSNYGGMLSDSAEARDCLFSRAVELATELGCESIEFRNTQPLPYDLEPRPDKMCMYLQLTPDPEQVWKSFNSKVRNQIRKAEKSHIIPASGHIELLDDFYRIYTIRMHQLGTPPYPRKLMKNILETFPDSTRIFLVRLGNMAVGAGLTIYFNGFVEIPWAATLVEYNRICPNNLLYWDIIKHYCLSGAKYFDFGRCTVDGPTYNFKKEWGTEPVCLNYQYWVRPGRKLSVMSPDNPKYKRKVEIWKRLPLWLTRAAGPYISRNLP